MAALSVAVCPPSGWLGRYLLGRDPRKPVPVLASAGLCGFAAGLDPAARQAGQWLVTEVPQRSLRNWQYAAAKLIAADLRGRVPVSND